MDGIVSEQRHISFWEYGNFRTSELFPNCHSNKLPYYLIIFGIIFILSSIAKDLLLSFKILRGKMADEENEGYWTPLEKYIRDYILTPITWILGFVPHAANILTISRFLIVFWAVLDFIFYHNPVERQIWFLTIAWITDLLDGPTARNNNNVTAFGTIADHTADFILTIWMLYLSFYFTTLLSGLAAILIYTVLTLTTAGMILMALGMRLFMQEKISERHDQPYLDFMREFLLKDLITTIGARINTTLAAFGIMFYLAGAIRKNDFYLYAGAVLLIVQLVSMGFYLHEIWQARYENRAYKIRRALENRVKELEEMFKKRKDSYPA